jgi:RNA polymerase sigma-70 factor (ECF subfamily)
LDSLSDNALMMKVRSGEISRLGLLYERHNKMLFGFFYRITGDRQASEDLVQNVFVRILKFKKQFRGEGKFSSWMYSIARNEMADYFKRQKRRPDDAVFSGWRDDRADPGSHLKMEKEKQLERVEQALGRLSLDKRELLVMSRYQGMKYKEIAEVYRATEGAIKVKIFRALNDLREIYRELEKTSVS